MEIITESEHETEKEAKRFIGLVEKNKNTEIATVIALFGDLGSGKTVFVKGISAELGVKERVISPTFVIERRYKVEHPTISTLIHIDAYRLESSSSLLAIDWRNTVREKSNLICLEWPENVEEVIPKNRFDVHFKSISEKKRSIKYLFNE